MDGARRSERIYNRYLSNSCSVVCQANYKTEPQHQDASNCLKFGHVNINGTNMKKMEKVERLIEDCDLDVLCITETHWERENKVREIKGFGKPVANILGRSAYSGGVCIYARKNLQADKDSIKKYKMVEKVSIVDEDTNGRQQTVGSSEFKIKDLVRFYFCSIEVCSKIYTNRRIQICTVYLNPLVTAEKDLKIMFLKFLDKVFKSAKYPTILLGDFNLDILFQKRKVKEETAQVITMMIPLTIVNIETTWIK